MLATIAYTPTIVSKIVGPTFMVQTALFVIEGLHCGP